MCCMIDNTLFYVGVTADLWRIWLAMAAGSKQPLGPDNILFRAQKTNVGNELDLGFS